MMMCLGMFVFGMHTLAYQELQRDTAWRHASTSRVGTNPARQFIGRGDDTITLPGVLVSGLTGTQVSLDVLRYMADTGKAWPLIEGTGRIYGLWVIESIKEGRSYFFKDGAARRIEFTINLQRIDDGQIDKIGALVSSVGNVMRRLF